MARAQASGKLAEPAAPSARPLAITLVPDEALKEVRLYIRGGASPVDCDWIGEASQVPRGQVAALREHVVAVMEAFAGLAAKGSPGDECSKLAEVLNVGALDADIVLLLSPALRRLMSVVPVVRTLLSLADSREVEGEGERIPAFSHPPFPPVTWKSPSDNHPIATRERHARVDRQVGALEPSAL